MRPAFVPSVCDAGFDPVTQDAALEFSEDGQHAGERPAGVVMSSPSVSDTKPTPTACSSCSVPMRSKSECSKPQRCDQEDGDDFPARVYLTFAYDPDKVSFGKKLKFRAGQAIFGDIPIGALNYIWDTKAPIGTLVENAYTDFAQMVVVASGAQKVGLWMSEERNVCEDYKQAFGEEPPMINGIAIMSVTDNTKEQVTAYYGDIVCVKAK